VVYGAAVVGLAVTTAAVVGSAVTGAAGVIDLGLGLSVRIVKGIAALARSRANSCGPRNCSGIRHCLECSSSSDSSSSGSDRQQS
jgi:hypothetical protein